MERVAKISTLTKPKVIMRLVLALVFFLPFSALLEGHPHTAVAFNTVTGVNAGNTGKLAKTRSWR